MMDLSIIILNYNTKKLTLDCIESIISKKWKSTFNIVVVDNASSDGSVDAIKEKYNQVKVIESNKNVGFSRGNNLALKKYYKNSKYCLLLNSDTIVLEDSIDKLVAFITKSDYCIVSCMLLNKDRSFQPNAGELPKPVPAFIWLSGLDDITRKMFRLPSYQERGDGYYKENRSVGWVSGSVMLISSTLIEEIGYLDSKIFMYAEDVDMCWRAEEHGKSVGWTKDAKIVHIGGASLDQPQYKQWLGEFNGLLYLYEKHYNKYYKTVLKLLMYIFIFVRQIAFWIIGKKEHSKTYEKILKEL